MKQAVEFAKEILRKQQAVNKTESKKLKKDYTVAIQRERKELRFYCYNKNISIEQVYKLAR